MQDPVDPPTGEALPVSAASDGCALDQGDPGTSAGSSLGDGSATSEARADLQDPSQIALAALRTHKRRRVAKNLPFVSEERVRELAAEAKQYEAGANSKVMKYARESPPLSPEARAALEALDSFDHPADPGIYYLWDQGRVVYVGKSRMGLMGAHLCAAVEVHARYGSQVKVFDRLSFQRCPEEMLDAAVGAVARWLRPKYNRGTKAPVTDNDQAVLQFLGLVARAA